MHKFPASLIRMKAEEELLKKEEEKARREFIRNEYMRKKQLKLMDDMDSVIKPRPPGAKQKKPRPKSMHRDIMESPKPPARTATGMMGNPGCQPLSQRCYAKLIKQSFFTEPQQLHFIEIWMAYLLSLLIKLGCILIMLK